MGCKCGMGEVQSAGKSLMQWSEESMVSRANAATGNTPLDIAKTQNAQYTYAITNDENRRGVITTKNVGSNGETNWLLIGGVALVGLGALYFIFK